MKIPYNVLNFAQSNVTVYEQFQDYFRHYMAENKMDIKGSYDNTITFAEKEEEMNKNLIAEICKQGNVVNFSEFKPEVMANNPNFKWATFAVIGAMIDLILPEVITASNFGMITEVRTGAYGDSFAFDVKPKDLFVVSKGTFGKRHGEVHKQFKGQVTVVPQVRNITVGVSLYRVLAGQESLAEFVIKAVRSIETQMATDIYTAFDTAMNALPTTPADGELKITGYTQDDLVSLGQRVTAYNGGQKAVILGTQLALSKVLPAGTYYRYMIESEFVKVGYVRTAFGFDAIELGQVADWTTPHKLLLDDTALYIISPTAGKPVKLCLEGALMTITDDVYANADLTQQATFKKSYGVAVVSSAVAGKITLS